MSDIVVAPQKRFWNVVVVMPAYNAEKTLERTLRDIPPGVVKDVIIVDDCSKDRTVEVAQSLGITVLRHEKNTGYGGNQKTCYDEALARGADAVVMIHPDYQYDPRIIPFALGFLATGVCDVVLGSRVRTRREALDSGMPTWKYIANRALTVFENVCLGQNLGDFHSGFRVYTREVIEKIPYRVNSDDFVFDTEFLAQAAHFGFRIGDVPIPCRYFREASSINFIRSMRYGFATVGVCFKFLLQKMRLGRFRIFRPKDVAK